MSTISTICLCDYTDHRVLQFHASLTPRLITWTGVSGVTFTTARLPSRRHRSVPADISIAAVNLSARFRPAGQLQSRPCSHALLLSTLRRPPRARRPPQDASTRACACGARGEPASRGTSRWPARAAGAPGESHELARVIPPRDGHRPATRAAPPGHHRRRAATLS